MYVAVEHTLQSEVDNYNDVWNGLSIALEDFDFLVKESTDSVHFTSIQQEINLLPL